MKTAQQLTLVTLICAALLSLVWPAALAWYAIIVLGGWVLFGVGVACLLLVGMVVG